MKVENMSSHLSGTVNVHARDCNQGRADDFISFFIFSHVDATTVFTTTPRLTVQKPHRGRRFVLDAGEKRQVRLALPRRAHGGGHRGGARVAA